MRREVLVIEEAFEQHVRVCARPEMHYYYYYYFYPHQPKLQQKYRNTFAIKLLHKAYNQHHVVCPTPALAQYRTVHRLSAGVR